MRACIMRGTVAQARAPKAGRLAQLVEHLVYTERVGGSSPSPPTIFPDKQMAGGHLPGKIPSDSEGEPLRPKALDTDSRCPGGGFPEK